MTASQLTTALLALRNAPTGKHTGTELADLMGVPATHAGKFIQQAMRHNLITKTDETAKCPQQRKRVPLYAVPEQPRYTEDDLCNAVTRASEATHKARMETYSDKLEEIKKEHAAALTKALRQQQEELAATHKAACDIYISQAQAAEDVTSRFTWAGAVLMLCLMGTVVWCLMSARTHQQEVETVKAEHAMELRAWADLYAAAAATADSLTFRADAPEPYQRVWVETRAYMDYDGWRSAENGVPIEGVKGWRK